MIPPQPILNLYANRQSFVVLLQTVFLFVTVYDYLIIKKKGQFTFSPAYTNFIYSVFLKVFPNLILALLISFIVWRIKTSFNDGLVD